MDNPSLKTRKRSAISPQWAHWRSVVEQWKDSGENPEEFCAHRSIVFSKFRWWRGHIEKQGGRAETRVATKAEPAFVPLVVRGNAREVCTAGSDAPPLELVLRGGCMVRVHPGFDESCLVRLVAALESARCG